MPEIIKKYWDAIVVLMDDEIREEMHNEMSPCTEEEFFEEYCKRHEEKFGSPFVIC